MALIAPDAPTVSSVADTYGGETTNPTLPSWEDELDDEFGCPTPIPSPAPTTPKESMTIRLILLVIIVVLINLGIKEYNNRGYIKSLMPASISLPSFSSPKGGKPVENAPPQNVVAPTENDLFNYEDAYRDLKERVAALEDSKKATSADVHEMKKKLTLLAIVNDENTMVARKHGQQFVYIDKDWNIDRMPSNIKYDERTRVFLEERVKQF